MNLIYNFLFLMMGVSFILEEEEEIDLMAVRKEREALKAQLAELETEMDGYLKELGYEK